MSWTCRLLYDLCAYCHSGFDRACANRQTLPKELVGVHEEAVQLEHEGKPHYSSGQIHPPTLTLLQRAGCVSSVGAAGQIKAEEIVHLPDMCKASNPTYIFDRTGLAGPPASEKQQAGIRHTYFTCIYNIASFIGETPSRNPTYIFTELVWQALYLHDSFAKQ